MSVIIFSHSRPNQPKLASRQKSIYTRSRVFVHPSLAAESPPKSAFAYGGFASGRMFLESDPIGLAGRSFSTYAYTNNNPISRIDRFGLAGESPEADETEEQREENDNAFVTAEAARLQAEINSLEPGYGEALPPGYRPSAVDLIRLERLVKEMREQQRCRNPAIQSPLRRVHTPAALTSGLYRESYAYWTGQPTQVIVNSLAPGQEEPLTVNSSGGVVQGNTRILILEQRGYDINSLPRVSQ